MKSLVRTLPRRLAVPLTLVLAVAAGSTFLPSSVAWAVPCIPGHETVTPPCTFDGLSLDSAAFTGQFEDTGAGHHVLVTFPTTDPLNPGPGIKIAADIDGGFDPFTNEATSTSATLLFTITAPSGLLIEDVSLELLEPFGPLSVTLEVGVPPLGIPLLGSLALNSTTTLDEFSFLPVSSITGTLAGSFPPGGPGTSSLVGVEIHFSLVPVPTVPAPSTLLLLGSGLAGLAAAAWRRSRRP